jgi:ribosomal protein S6
VALSQVRQELSELEKAFKSKRDVSRELTVKLVSEYRYSVARAADLSGHHRNTIAVWLQIHNAETRRNGSK